MSFRDQIATVAGVIADAAQLANECGEQVLYSDLKRADDTLVYLAAGVWLSREEAEEIISALRRRYYVALADLLAARLSEAE